MEELLEDLAPALKKELLRHCEWAELTVASINTGKGRGLVVTNQAVYLFRKGWLGIKTTIIPLKEILCVEADNAKIIFTGKGRFTAELPKHRQALAEKVAQIVAEKIT